MRKLVNIILTASLLVGISVSAMAKTPRINNRQHKQQDRIANGINNGDLTAREAARLETEQAKIASDKRMAKADGHVGARERRQMAKEQNKANHDIYRQKHDGQAR